MKIRCLLPVAAALALSACATAPKPLQGQFEPITPQQTLSTGTSGQSVRWGGRIIDTLPGPNQTCFQLLSRPLNALGRPMTTASDASDGRFIACRSGFYDPAVFQPGRDVTFIGRVAGQETVKIGEYEYHLPKLMADVVYLWPEQRAMDMGPYPYGPGYGPWGPWGPWGPHSRFGYRWW
jgi:outer membrane lipoprotein